MLSLCRVVSTNRYRDSLCTCLFLSALETTIVSTSLLDIVKHLGGGANGQWVIVAYLLTYNSMSLSFSSCLYPRHTWAIRTDRRWNSLPTISCTAQRYIRSQGHAHDSHLDLFTILAGLCAFADHDTAVRCRSFRSTCCFHPSRFKRVLY